MKKSGIQTYRDLIVWQKSMKLVNAVYELTKEFPATELYGLTSQVQSAAVSIPSNIAEGYGRNRKNARLTHFQSPFQVRIEN